jgi:diketogulonate reductase-like aldo/keto reductase
VDANGLAIPALGQGGWHVGDDPAKAEGEIAALRRGLELGMALVDTAEMYGQGRSERLIGQALAGAARGPCLIVSKVLPENAGRPRIFSSCAASLARLGVGRLDLYLLHWRGPVPLAATVACMEELRAQGKIRRWGVSNFDVPDMEDLFRVPGGERCAVDQVLYHVGSRGAEFDLFPWLAAHGVAAMAYCPLAQGGTLRRLRSQDFLGDGALNAVAAKHGLTVPQLMLAFALRDPRVCAIPKASSVAHVEQNARALAALPSIPQADWDAVDAAFPPPTHKMHLDIE